MGTRAVIAIPLDNGFKGRYCHWDGYPTHLAAELVAIVKRDGVEQARKVLTEEHSAWSAIYADPRPTSTPSTTGTRCPGYGTPSTDDEDWWIETGGDDDGTEWAYVLNEQSLSVFQRMHRDDTPAAGTFGFNDDDGYWLYLGEILYEGEVSDKLLTTFECGAHFERCRHYAWAHVEGLSHDDRRGMAEYLRDEGIEVPALQVEEISNAVKVAADVQRKRMEALA